MSCSDGHGNGRAHPSHTPLFMRNSSKFPEGMIWAGGHQMMLTFWSQGALHKRRRTRCIPSVPRVAPPYVSRCGSACGSRVTQCVRDCSAAGSAGVLCCPSLVLSTAPAQVAVAAGRAAVRGAWVMCLPMGVSRPVPSCIRRDAQMLCCSVGADHVRWLNGSHQSCVQSSVCQGAHVAVQAPTALSVQTNSSLIPA